MILITKRIRYTFLRDSIYYIQICLPDGKMFRRSLGTDSHREANTLMIALMPSVLNVKEGACPPEKLSIQIEELTQTRMRFRAARVSPDLYTKPAIAAQINNVDVINIDRRELTLGEAWERYVKDKGKAWTAAIHSANERYMEVMLTVLGAERDVKSITRQDIKLVMEAVTGLPKRVVQPYRSMTIAQLLSCDDIPEEHLLGTEAIHKHLKIYKSLFKTYLTEDKNILSSSPTDGVSAPPSSNRYGAYTNAEMKQLVAYAFREGTEEWLKWMIALLAYTGARRGEIATLNTKQIMLDADTQRYYILIQEGKTENAVRQVPVHSHLIERGLLEYAERMNGELFPLVSNTNMSKIGKVVSDVRDSLGIPHLDVYGQRRIVHSIRHSVMTSASSWMNDLTHLQQVVGHEKLGTGITRRYLHTYPLSAVLHVIDGLSWI